MRRFRDGGERLIDLPLQGAGGICSGNGVGAPVGICNGAGELSNEPGSELAAVGELVERAVFIETAQMDRPFDDLASPAELKARRIPGDRDDSEVEVRSVSLVDLELALAGEAPLFEGRKIHEGEQHRLLDLVDILACEKHRGAMGVDSKDRLAKAVRCGIA